MPDPISRRDSAENGPLATTTDEVTVIDVYVNGNQREAEVTFSTLRLNASDPADLKRASALLADGGVVAFPTETVYGLGADATNATAVANLYAAKGRPAFNPLIAHLPTIDAAIAEGEFDATAIKLATAFWPGPLTIVVPRRAGSAVVDLATAGLGTLAIRVPAHPVAIALLTAVGRPIVAPSANRSGHVSPTTAAHVLADLDGRINAVLDGGPAGIGLESTIIGRFDGVTRLLRPGAVTRAMLEAVAGEPVVDGMALVTQGVTSPSAPDADSTSNTPIAPGRLLSHYAPNAKVVLDAVDVRDGEAVLDFGGQFPDAAIRLDLSPDGDTVEAAANLYGYLRALDARGVAVIKVARVGSEGLGEAIRDRLGRAAAGR